MINSPHRTLAAGVAVAVTTTGGVPGVPADAAHLSADGRYAAFRSAAPDLVPGGSGTSQAYLRDLTRRTTELISVTHDGSPSNGGSTPAGVSANGRYVLFVSEATNLLPSPPHYGVPRLSPDGQFVLMNELPHRPPGEWRWESRLRNHADPFNSLVIGVSLDGGTPNDSIHGVGASTGGRYVLFHSLASDLVPGDTNQVDDVFVRDRRAGTTVRASVATGGAQGNADSDSALISGQGRFVVFGSAASNLVPGDSNGTGDVFVRDLRAGTTVRVSVG
ncbi:hypothetical protein GCM10011608_57580 [Micromonospora sonchi]|uniref:Uncharacterized protein n=1 Tax=Micromonospora sonchi TaxID=1763543 RepID=A0A917U9N0_9ACTN|nr:hypothetical protein [Micromonospora sonchi]GGM64659.1 hypothetical protein GCM10011608_57580 [Micromonospora sonchi]